MARNSFPAWFFRGLHSEGVLRFAVKAENENRVRFRSCKVIRLGVVGPRKKRRAGNGRRFCNGVGKILAVYKHSRRVRVLRLSCKMWGCPKCDPWMGKKLRAEIIRCTREHNLSEFWTFTISPERANVIMKKRGKPALFRWTGKFKHYKNPHTGKLTRAKQYVPINDRLAWEYVSKVWHRFCRAVLKRLKGDEVMKFLWTKERQNTGICHMHVLMHKISLSDSEIKRLWYEAGGGKQVKVIREWRDVTMRDGTVKDGLYMAALYLAKYITMTGYASDLAAQGFDEETIAKALEEQGNHALPLPKGCRRFGSSLNIDFDMFRVTSTEAETKEEQEKPDYFLLKDAAVERAGELTMLPHGEWSAVTETTTTGEIVQKFGIPRVSFTETDGQVFRVLGFAPSVLDTTDINPDSQAEIITDNDFIDYIEDWEITGMFRSWPSKQ